MALCNRFNPVADIEVVIWHIEESEEYLRSLIPPFLMTLYESSLEKMKSQKRRNEWLGARALLHSVLNIHSPICYKESGCPNVEGCHISISHTGRYVALAFSKKHEIGVDIEQYGSKIMRVADRFIAPSESLKSELTCNYALFLWTVKEAVYKMGNIGPNLKDEIFVSPIILKDQGRALAEVPKRETSYEVYYMRCEDFFLSLTWK